MRAPSNFMSAVQSADVAPNDTAGEIDPGASGLAKVLWTLFVLIAPLIGVIVWFFIGPKSSQRLA